MDSQLILVSAFPMLVLEKVLGVQKQNPSTWYFLPHSLCSSLGGL